MATNYAFPAHQHRERDHRHDEPWQHSQHEHRHPRPRNRVEELAGPDGPDGIGPIANIHAMTGWTAHLEDAGRYNRPMNPPPSPTPAVSALLPTSGLTEVDQQRIAAAIEASLAPSTRTIYSGQWNLWTTWCEDRGLDPLPAEPASVCGYLTHRADQGLAASSIDIACSAISHHHRQAGHHDPVSHPAVRQVRTGLRRILGTAPRRPARPLDVPALRRILRHIDRDTLTGARDAAILLIGFASALRRSELAGLALADVEARPQGLILTVRHSKTDQEAAGQPVAVAHGHRATTDPVAALDHWLHHRGRTPGPLFVNLRTRTLTTQPMSGEGIARMIKRRAADAGYSGERFTGHSLRAGHATTAALAGASLEKIAAQTRHRRLSTLLERYIRPADALTHTTSSDLGL